MFKYITILWFALISIALDAQKDYLYSLDYSLSPINTLGKVNIKAMEDQRALIFLIDYQPDHFNTYLTKVDYDGNELFTTKINLDNYRDVMLVDGVESNGHYILIGTAVNTSDGKPYFITVRCEADITQMYIVDQRLIQYPVFTSYTYAIVPTNTNAGQFSFVFNIGVEKEQNSEMYFVSFGSEGLIYSLESLGKGFTFTDHIYNTNTKKHYIVANKYIIIYNEENGIERYFDFFVNLDDVRYFNTEYKIISADDSKINLLGRWGSERALYTYTIYLDDEGWQQGSYNDDVFPNKKYYTLAKTVMPNTNAIISVSTDLLDGSRSNPNETYFWELDSDGLRLKTYRIDSNIKSFFAVTDVDKNCNMLGWGNYLLNYSQSFNYFIMPCDNKYLVGTDNVPITSSHFEVFPNPVINTLSIPLKLINATITIYNLTGQKFISNTIMTDTDTQIDVSHLVQGSYILSALKDGRLYYSKFIKM